MLVINCQSIKSPGKPAQLQNIIQSTRADIIINTESWLSPDIKSPEVFPSSFNCYRRDRPKGQGGGIFLQVSNLYESEEPEELKVDQDCELVWARVKVQGSKDLYVGSLYRPPDIHDPEYLETLRSYLARIPTHNRLTSGLVETLIWQILTGMQSALNLIQRTVSSVTDYYKGHIFGASSHRTNKSHGVQFQHFRLVLHQ